MGRTKYACRGRATDGTHQRNGAGVGFGSLESGLRNILLDTPS